MPFVLQKESSVPELDSIIRLYRHERTGARLLSVINKDENKVFGISFRTPPERNNGVVHIIEHSTLCGSRKYPVKEPFVELMKGSLNTFLNAITFEDKTCYPVASTNLKDFYNLIDVYLDAVFYPNLTEYTFMQEGWHYEVDPVTRELSYKGVVFNEMKGAYSDPDSLHDHLCKCSLFPDTCYGLDSGGDPLEIPTLSYEEFIAYHKKYYHPSNSFIYFYGDDDPEKRLSFMDEWLSPFEAASIDSLPAIQQTFPEPLLIKRNFQANSKEAAKAYTAVNWMLYEHGDMLLSMQALVLFHILTGTPASPLRKALIESGLGEDIAGFGFYEEMRQTAFSIGLKGVEPHNLAKVEELIFSTLERLACDGIDPDTIAASLNTMEFALRERNTGSFPRGLAIMLDALNEWLYDLDPISALSFAEPLEQTKRAAKENHRLFSELIDSLILKNKHRSTVRFLPSSGLKNEREEAEKAMLALARASLDDEALRKIEDTAKNLKELQDKPDSPEALATIPVLSLDDIPGEAPVLPSEPLESATEEFKGSGIYGYYHELSTSGILYLDLGFGFGKLPSRLLPYVSLLGRFLIETGTEKYDFVQLIQRIGMHTGGIRSMVISTTHWAEHRPVPWFFLRAKALPEKVGILSEILLDILTSAQLDNRERVRQIVLEEKAQAEAMLIPASARIVGLRLRSRFNSAYWASERLMGIERLFFLRKLLRNIEEDWPSVLSEIREVHSELIWRDNLLVNITSDKAILEASAESILRIAQSLPMQAMLAQSLPHRSFPQLDSWVNEASRACYPSFSQGHENSSPKNEDAHSARIPLETIELQTQVNSVGMIMPLKGLDPIAGGALAATKYLDTSYLWEQIRVIGGAYGGFSSLDLASALLMFLSYRDPNFNQTIEAYRKVATFLESCNLPREEIQKSIIGTIGDMDAYQLPDAKGFNALMNILAGYTQETRQHIRDQILAANMDDFRSFGKLLSEALDRSMIVVMTSPEQAEKALSTLPAPIARLSLQ
ncbi:MAG: peptidase M16 [Treponema sp.]|nr:peptidase M16 [Treponema sp.]